MDTVRIPLTQGKFALIDECDAERVRSFRWHALRSGRRGQLWYAARSNAAHQKIFLHRFILDAEDSIQVDHINGDGLDCRRLNMRECSRAQNAANARLSNANKSGYRGVSWDKSVHLWYASIRVDGRTLYLGRHADAEMAARAYDAAARKYFGEFARLNLP